MTSWETVRMIKRIKEILNNITEATLKQTLTNFNMDAFVTYYLETIWREYQDLPPDQLVDYIEEEMESDEYSQEYENEFGHPYEVMDTDSEEYVKFTRSRVYKNIVKNYLQQALNHTLPNLRRLASQPKITVYRLLKYHSTTQYFRKHMTVEPEEEYVDHLAKYGGRLGIYWTETKETIPILADSLTAGDDLDEDYYLFEVNIDSSHINWYDTLYQRVHIEYGDWQEWKPEQEIRLFKNTPIKLVSLSRYNPDEDEFDPQDISAIQGKTFYA
jgi:hypothetical protein